MTWIVTTSVSLSEKPRELGRWMNEDHDRAQDRFFLEKTEHPEHIVEMRQEGSTTIWVVQVEGRLDALFSSQRDAEAWARQVTSRGDLRVTMQVHEAPVTDNAKSVALRRTLWDRLLEDD